MSRIGKKTITVPTGVEVKIEGQKVTVKGKKGELNHTLPASLKATYADNTLTVTPLDQERQTRALWGLNRTLLQNMVTGVSEGFTKRLEVNGVGYRFLVQGKKIKLELGFSNPIEYTLPDTVTITVNEKTKNIMELSSPDKQKLGQVCAEIRGFRPPEPYKGKGIKYSDEHIVRKAGKTAASASS